MRVIILFFLRNNLVFRFLKNQFFCETMMDFIALFLENIYLFIFNVKFIFLSLCGFRGFIFNTTHYFRYTTDDWATSKDTKAMIVKAQSHPALSHFVTKAMRFYIDCDDLTVGDVLKFSLHCYASQNNKQYFLDSDDNEGLCYQVNCTPKLNPWAAKAAQELKNYAPIVKYNCMHNSKDSESKAAKSLSEDSLQP